MRGGRQVPSLHPAAAANSVLSYRHLHLRLWLASELLAGLDPVAVLPAARFASHAPAGLTLLDQCSVTTP